MTAVHTRTRKQKQKRALRPPGLLSRDEILELGKKAREALFPAHESEIGFARNKSHVVHGVVKAHATTTSEMFCACVCRCICQCRGARRRSTCDEALRAVAMRPLDLTEWARGTSTKELLYQDVVY